MGKRIIGGYFMKRKRFLAAAVAAAMLLGLAGCSSSSNSSGNGGTQEQTNTEDSGDTIKIGYVSALSGDTWRYGTMGPGGPQWYEPHC